MSKAAIISAGLRIWREKGETAVTARAIGKEVRLSHSGVLWHWNPGGMAALKHDLALHAVDQGDARIIPQLIVQGHPAVAGMDPATRQAWLASA